MNIAVAGIGYVGLSLAVMLSQHNHVDAVDVVPEKVEKLKRWESPIQNAEIERFLTVGKSGERPLDLSALSTGRRRTRPPIWWWYPPPLITTPTKATSIPPTSSLSLIHI